MDINGKNTILITGGGSGIGRGLAEAFHRLGNHVIIAGRRKDVLDEVTKANPGMAAEVLDVQDAGKLKSFAADITAKYADLNVVIHMAGIMKMENLSEGADPEAIASMIATNLTAPLQLTAALMPHLKKQAKAAVITVSSGLAFMPLAMTPTYCATKAAIHSWTDSLRYQLKGTSVQVIELPPPYVQTELMGEQQKSDPRAMPLADFISEVMELLGKDPEAKEILVKNVHPLRFAGDLNAEKYYGFFEQFNNAFSGH